MSTSEDGDVSDAGDDVSIASDSISESSDEGPKKNKKKVAKQKAAPKQKSTATPKKRELAGNNNGVATKKLKTDTISTVTVAPNPPVAKTIPYISVPDIGEEDITRGPDVTTEAAAKKLVSKYLRIQNRPYSVIQIFDNLHKRIPKTLLERSLTVLCEESGESSQILCKEYGKAKIYFPNQHSMTSNFTDADLQQLERDCTSLKQQLNQALADEKANRQKLHDLQNEPDDDAIDSILDVAEKKILELQKQIKDLLANPVDPRAYSLAIRQHNSTRSSWKQRKDLCMEGVETLADGMEKSVKAVMGELGIETDVDAGEVMPALIPERK